MTGQTTAATGVERARRSWRLALAAVRLAAGTNARVWFVAVPWGPLVCPAVYPIPANCLASNRGGTALMVSLAVLAVGFLTVATAMWTRRTRALAVAGVILLAVAPVVAYLTVAWSPGFPLA